MRGAGLIVAGLMAVVGLIWVGQGAGLIQGSFMTGDRRWLLIGALLLVSALVLFALSIRGRRSA